MVSKTCPKCKGKSYSASDRGKWIYPYCKEDLSKIKINTAKIRILKRIK